MCSLCTIFLVQHTVVAPSIFVITSNVQSLYNLFSSTYSSCSQYHCYHFERVACVQSFQFNIQQLLLVSLLSLRTCSLCTIYLVQHIVVAPNINVITSNVSPLYNLFSSTYSSCSQYHCYHFERVVFVQSFQFNTQQLLLVSLLSLRTCSLCTIFLVQHSVVAPSIIVITSNVLSLYNLFSSTYSSCSQFHCYHFERVVFVQSFQFNIQQLLLASLLSLRTCSHCTIFLVQHIVVAPSIFVITSNVQSLYNLFSSTYSSCSQYHCYLFERVVSVQPFQFNIQWLLVVSLLSLLSCSLCTIFVVQHIVLDPSIIVITSNVQSLYKLFSSTYSSCSQYHCYHFERVVFVQSFQFNIQQLLLERVVFVIVISCSVSLLSLRTCSLSTIFLVQHIVVDPSIIVITSNVQPLYNRFSSRYSSRSWYLCYHFESVVFVQSSQSNIQQLLLASLLSLRTCSLCTIFLVQHIVVAPSIIVITSNVQSLYNRFSSRYSSRSRYLCYHFERVVFVQSFQSNIQQLLLASLLSLRTCSLCTIFLVQHIVVAPSIIVITSNVQPLYNLFSSTYCSCSQYHCYHFDRVVFVQSFQFKIQQSLLVPLLSLRTCSLCTIFLVQHIVVAPSFIVITSNVYSVYNLFSSTYSSCSQYLCYHFERVVFVQSTQFNIQQLLLTSMLSLRTCRLCTIFLVQHIAVAPSIIVIISNVQSLYNLFSSTHSSCSQFHCYHFERVVFVQSFQFNIQQLLLVSLLSLRTCCLCTIFLVQHIVVAPSFIVITSNVQSLYNLFSSTYSSCSQHHCYHFERVVCVQSFQFNIQQLLLVSLLSLRTCSLCTIFLVQHIAVAPSIIVITSNVQSVYNLFSSTYSSCSQYLCYHFERVVFVQSTQFNIQQLLLTSMLSLRTCRLCTIFLVQHIAVAPSIIVIISNVQSLYNLFSSTHSSCSQFHCYHFERVVFVQSFQFNIQQLLLVSLLSLRTCCLCTIFLVQHIVVAPSFIVITSNVQSLYNLFSSTYSSCSQHHCYHFERVVIVQSFQFNIQQLLLVSLLSLRTCSLCTIFLVQRIAVAPSIIVTSSNVQSLYNLFSSTYSGCWQFHCYHF